MINPQLKERLTAALVKAYELDQELGNIHVDFYGGTIPQEGEDCKDAVHEYLRYMFHSEPYMYDAKVFLN